MASPIVEFFTQLPQGLQWFLMGTGAVFLATKVLGVVNMFTSVFLLSGTSLSKYGKPGSWAVITGASDGLGKEFAFQLAAKGFNVVLVSRTESKLVALAEEIKEKYAAKNIQTRIVAMDYTQDRAEDYARLASTIADLDVAILINNVGVSHSIPVNFLETSPAELHNIVTVNCLGTLKTTQVVAPLLVRRKKGLILTMGSFAGWMPTPLLATYSGSKAFLQHWNSAMAAELAPQGVDAYLVVSYLVTTAMSKLRRTSLMIPNPKGFVRAALGKIGTGSAYMVATSSYAPYWSHALMLWAVESTIGQFHAIGVKVNRSMHIDIRTRALKKAARNAKKE